jgi:ABC-2 type transport system permease protein
MGLSMGILCLCYLLRAAGDIPSDAAHNPLGFASVLGLGERAYPYYENLWWPLGVMLGIAAVLTALAFILGGVRDHGAGLLPLLRGKAHAGRLLVGQLSLGLRLMRGLIFAWALIILLLSASYGYVFNDMDAFYKGSEILQAILGTPGADANILEPVIHTISAMMALLSVVPVVLIIGRLGTEERRGRLDLIYAGASSRTHAFVGYALIAALVATLLQVLAAFGIGAAQALSMDNPVALVVFMRAALNMLPAVLVFEGIALCLLGAAPRFMPALWLHLGYSLYGVYLAGAFALPEWLTMLNPFSALARYPVEPFAWVPWCILLAIFVALGALGAVRYRFRSLN